MVRTFEELFKELQDYLGVNIEDADKDKYRIKIDDKLSVQMEVQYNKGELLVFAEIGEVPPGRYKEEFFRALLVENGKPLPHFGSFGYSEKKNMAILFDFLPLNTLSGETFANYIDKFSGKAIKWMDILQSGELPTWSQSKSSHQGGMFGLTP